MMFAATTSTDLINGQLNADFYSPLYVDIEKSIRTCGVKSSRLGAKVKRVLKGAFYLLASEYQESGIPFIRVSQINSSCVDLSDTVFISAETHTRENKTAVKPGYLLVAKGGAYRHVAVVPDHIEDANISQDLIGAVPEDGFDTHFAFAFLISEYGRPQLIRWQQGGAQPHLTNDSIKHILLPDPNEAAQNYIGDKVRQAERLRSVAKVREQRFHSIILGAYPQLCETVPGTVRHGRARPVDMEGVLNPGAFNPDRLFVRGYMKANGGQKVKQFASVETPVTSNYHISDPYVGLDSISSASGAIHPSTIGAEEVVGAARLLPEGPAISKLRPYLNKVAYIPSNLAGALGSTELLCVQANDRALNWYLCGVLRLQSTVRQLNPASTGSTHPRATRADVLDTYVPWIDDPIDAGRLLEDAQKACFLSANLVLAAKMLVETLIERQISEDELSAAQSQLEQGDQSGDRAILSRLYEGGIDATDTKRLFPDLDGYYETLQLAEQTEPDGGTA